MTTAVEQPNGMSTHHKLTKNVREDWEDREYFFHLKRLQNIQRQKGRYNYEPEDPRVKFPHLYRHRRNSPPHSGTDSNSNSNVGKTRLDNSNPEYEVRRQRQVRRQKFRNEVEVENERLRQRLLNAKGFYDFKKMDEDYDKHAQYVRLNEKKFYTPRGLGRRKYESLPEIKNQRREQNKNSLKLLNDAVNKQERGDVALMKTLCNLNYSERMTMKQKYEEAYETDLKKGLIKVMDKQYEPIIAALLTDTNQTDVDRIYESLYDQGEAATVITELIVSRDQTQRELLISSFNQKMDSTLETEITNKIEGNLRLFLLSLLKNKNLDNTEKAASESKIQSDIKELKKNKSFTSSFFLDNIVGEYSTRDLKHFFSTYSQVAGEDLFNKMDTAKPVEKGVKLLQAYLSSPAIYKAEKLQKYFKSNKAEFLRLLAYYPQNEMVEVQSAYKKRYNSSLEDEIKDSFTPEMSRLILKILHKRDEN